MNPLHAFTRLQKISFENEEPTKPQPTSKSTEKTRTRTETRLDHDIFESRPNISPQKKKYPPPMTSKTFRKKNLFIKEQNRLEFYQVKTKRKRKRKSPKQSKNNTYMPNRQRISLPLKRIFRPKKQQKERKYTSDRYRANARRWESE